MINIKIKNLFKNVSYTIFANVIQMITSIVIVLLIPKVISTEEYAYFQLYLFYISYVGFFHLGLIDGIYLKYGGKEYKDLDKSMLQSQLISLIAIITIISVLFFTIITKNTLDLFKKEVYFGLLICVFTYVPFTFFQFISQITCRIALYAKCIIIQQFIYFFGIMICIMLNRKQFKYYIIADLVSKFIPFIYVCFIYKDIFTLKNSKYLGWKNETKDNIRVGSKLLLSNVAGMLIIGIARYMIENKWDIVTFGKISLVISICNFMLAFVSAIGLVLFPMLRRVDIKKMKKGLIPLDFILTLCLFGIMVFYQPLKEFIIVWLPKYKESLIYMSILFPICIFECKMSLIVTTYLKVIREEKLLLRINVGSLVTSTILVCFSTFIFYDLKLVIYSIVLALGGRCIIGELFLARKMNIQIEKIVLLEIVGVAIFIFINSMVKSLVAFGVYLFLYLAYVIWKRELIVISLKKIKTYIC